MKKIFLALFSLVMLGFSTHTSAATDIEFILDISGSMNKSDGTETQMESLRKALATTIKDIPDGTFVAVRLYAHRVEQANKAESCKDTELAIPFGAINRQAITDKINLVSPKGYTPIAYALEQSKNDFLPTRESNKTIILMTDGEETCGGDPKAVVEKMKAEGFNVTIHAVGFNVDANTRAQLQGIATAGGGQYYDASGSTGLQNALKQATQQSLLIEKKNEIIGEEIRGGNGFDSAVAITPGTIYRLDHHQKTNDYDYFYFDVKAGSDITVGVMTGAKGLNIEQNGKQTENESPYAGITLVGPDKNQIKRVQIIAKKHGLEKITYNAPADGRYYIMFGTEYDDMHKDYATFKVAVVSKGDLGTDKDAGVEMDSSLPVEFKRYEKNHLSNTDRIDTYSFTAKKGDQIQIGYVPMETDEPYMGIKLFDSYKQQVFQKGASKGQGLRSDVITIPNDDTYYLQLELQYGIEKTFRYILEIKKIDPEPVATSTSSSTSTVY